jgi:hypothetical protein
VSQAVVDDHALRALLSEDVPGPLGDTVAGRTVWTTFAWYHRLCLSLTNISRPGVLSGPVVSLPPAERRRTIAAAAALPEWIGMFSGRDVAWPMAKLRHDHAPAIRLNLLAAEPLAVAGLLGRNTIIVIAEGNVPPSLAAAAEGEGIPVQTVSMR